MNKVFGVVCTYNRRELLARCVEAMMHQTVPPDRIVIFDNGSTDGTEAYIAGHAWPAHPPIHYLRVETNLGCAAGFHRALEAAYRAGCEWAWIMDDDTVVAEEALAELEAAYRNCFSDTADVGFLTSRIVTPDGEPNNVQLVDERRDVGGYKRWSSFLAQGLVMVRWTSLNSTLIPRATLSRHFGPSPDFVIWGDDIDFTARITKERPGYLVGRSLAVHHTRSRAQLNIFDEVEPERIRNFYYHYRNGVYIRRAHYGPLQMMLFLAKSLVEAAGALAGRNH